MVEMRPHKALVAGSSPALTTTGAECDLQVLMKPVSAGGSYVLQAIEHADKAQGRWGGGE